MCVCPNCETDENVVTNQLFSMHNPNRWFCEGCSTFFG